jgi:DNA-binding LacI/PurR family transcriptional regulator
MQPCAPVAENGCLCTKELLSTNPNITALLCYNDLVAVGALKACAELGLRVPDDVAVVGFDNIPLAALVTPALTTCHIPRYELGVKALELLLKQTEQNDNDTRKVILQPSLIIRSSAP